MMQEGVDPKLKTEVIIGLSILKAGVDHLNALYEKYGDRHDELNSFVDERIVPMSLDEWSAEIDAVIDEIREMCVR